MLKKKDVIFLFLLFIIGVILTLIIYIPKSPTGSTVQVQVNGNIIATYRLGEDTLVPIGNKSKDYNLLQIKNGAASILNANCKDKYCVHQKKISVVGESIVCLPHFLTITIVSDKQHIPDAVAFQKGV